MASAKGKGAGPDPEKAADNEEPATVITTGQLGFCRDCGQAVDVVVDIHQVQGDGTFICIDCRAKRMKQKCQENVGALKAKADEARENARQQLLPGMN